MNWSSSSDRYLYFDAKQPGTFLSARWGIVSNPDLCFVLRDCQGQPLQVSCKTLSQFPQGQHKPILINISIEIPLITSKRKSCWNFRKADWEKYTTKVETKISDVDPVSKSYTGFCKILKDAARHHILIGFRESYMPCWNPDKESHLKEYESTGSYQQVSWTP